jgi:hypothetical protein
MSQLDGSGMHRINLGLGGFTAIFAPKWGTAPQIP